MRGIRDKAEGWTVQDMKLLRTIVLLSWNPNRIDEGLRLYHNYVIIELWRLVPHRLDLIELTVELTHTMMY